MSSAPALFTVGYEGRTVDSLVAALAEAKIDSVTDVRLHAMSRKPGFSRKRLAAALGEAGIAYDHEPALGNPRDNRDGFRRGDPAAYDLYARHLRFQTAALARTLQRGWPNRLALLCFERDHARCHRSMIAAEMLSTAALACCSLVEL